MRAALRATPVVVAPTDTPANDYNSGGGAGANGGAGGLGGYGWNSIAATNSTDGGFGGAVISRFDQRTRDGWRWRRGHDE